jgi:hypothetical protein
MRGLTGLALELRLMVEQLDLVFTQHEEEGWEVAGEAMYSSAV